MRHPKDITINGKQLDEILKAHKAWLMYEEGGIRAALSYADLSDAALSYADLSRADLRRADLRGADLSGADLSGADLSDAALSYADLSDADLRGAVGTEFAEAITSITPEGELIGWKKLRSNRVAKLLIPSDAKRSNATGRKCRAEYAKVLEIWDGAEKVDEGISQHDLDFTYHVGDTVRPDKWDDNRWDECSNGIHFFITKIEASNY